MRTRTITIAATALLLAACGTGTPTEGPAPTEATRSATEATQEPVEPTTVAPTTAEPEPEEMLEHCAPTETQGPIGEAILTAELPDTTRITSVEEFPPLPDAEDQNSTFVEVTLCSVPLNGDEHRTIATDITRAAMSAEGPGIYRISVALLMPREDGSMGEGRAIYLEDVQTVMEWADPAIMNTWRTA